MRAPTFEHWQVYYLNNFQKSSKDGATVLGPDVK